MQNKSFPAVQFRIARPTHQLAALEHFYVHLLGLPKLGGFEAHDGYNGIMIGLPDGRHHLEFTQTVAQAQPCLPPSKDNLLVFYLDDEEALSLIRQRLESAGHLPVEPENPYWNNKSYTYQDPDGWRIVLYRGHLDYDETTTI